MALDSDYPGLNLLASQPSGTILNLPYPVFSFQTGDSIWFTILLDVGINALFFSFVLAADLSLWAMNNC
jgi:hypothetical protein